MASRNGPKHHHNRRHQSSENNRRRLSKQEEIDLGGIESDDNSSAPENNGSKETPLASVTIHVEDRCDQKLVENESSDYESNSLTSNNDEISMHNKSSAQSQSLAINPNECKSLIIGDIKEKKRGKQLIRSEALRDISPPPDSENFQSNNMLTVSPLSPQTPTGPSINAQNRKNKIKQQQGSSQGSLDENSPSLSRDSSTENYTDSTGTDLQQFLTDTLQKNQKDRIFLLKIEQDLTQFVKDPSRPTLKFPQMTSYNRMLVHRVAAFYGMDHNVDGQGTAIVVTKTKSTRIPDLKFKDYIRDELLLHEPKKSILKRDSASLEDNSNQSSIDGKEKSPDRQNGTICGGTRSKSFEEREERYEKARARIFNQDSSSSSVEGIEGSGILVITDNSGCHAGSITLQSNSSLRSSQEDLQSSTLTNEPRAWSSTDSESPCRIHKYDAKQNQSSNSMDSDSLTPAPKTAIVSSASTTCGGITFLSPDCISSDNVNSGQNKNRPSVTKASSFGGISMIRDNGICSTGAQSKLTKSGSFNVASTVLPNNNNGSNNNSNNSKAINTKQENTQNATVAVNNNGPNGSSSNSKAANIKQENAQNAFNNLAQPASQQPRSLISQQTSHPIAASHNHTNPHQPWLHNLQMRPNEMAAMNAVGWPQVVNPNFQPYMIAHVTDTSGNQPKEAPYAQAGQQQLYVAPVAGFGHQQITSEQQALQTNIIQDSQVPVLYLPCSLAQQNPIGYKTHSMQISDNSSRRVPSDSIVSQLNAVSISSPSPPIQFPFIRAGLNNSMNPGIVSNNMNPGIVSNNMNPGIASNSNAPKISGQPVGKVSQVNHPILQPNQQQPIRFVYTNPHQVQPNVPLFGSQVNSTLRPNHQVTNQANQVPFQLQPTQQTPISFPTSQSNQSQATSNGFNSLIQQPSISHSYGAPVQVPSGLGTVWIINNQMQGNTTNALIPGPGSNTPSTPPISSNIAPFVGMSYQQFHPNMNTTAPNAALNAAPQNSLLKAQSLLANQPNSQQRMLVPNGNHFTPQVPHDLVDMNLLGANNFVNRTALPNPPINPLFRRMPLVPNQPLDVRLFGSHPTTSPFLLPTPQRPFIPLTSPNVVHNRPQGQHRSKNSSKHRRQQQQQQQQRSNSINNATIKNNSIVSSNNSNTNNCAETRTSAKCANESNDKCLSHEDKYVCKVSGLPKTLTKSELEHYLQAATAIGGKLKIVYSHGTDGACEEFAQNGSTYIEPHTIHHVLIVFEHHAAYENALRLRDTRFELHPLSSTCDA